MEHVEKYAQAALENACNAISAAQSGSRNHVLNSEAFGIGQLVGSGIIGFADARSTLLTAAKQSHIERHEAEATIDSGLRGGMKNPRDVTTLNGHAGSPPIAPKPMKTTADYARDLYREAAPMAGTLAERYLREHRDIDGPLPNNFRFHAGVWHKEAGNKLPAMVAPITRTDDTGARINAVHITFLDPATGAKSKIDPAKKMYGSCRHGAIWLGEYAAHMLCAEGIEKGLACQSATGINAAVGLSATLLPSIIWPRGVQKVTLCADPNGAGESAIHKAARNLAADGIKLLVCYPPLAGRDWDETQPEQVRDAIEAAKPWHAPKARPSKAMKALSASVEDSRPLIQIAAGHLARIADEGEAQLIAAGVGFYRRGNRLVRPVIDAVPASDDRETGTPRLAGVDDVYMRLTLARHIRWEKFDGRVGDWVAADPTKEIASTINARYGDWRFPAVTGIIGTQTMRRDGSLILEPGYDARTGLILVDPPNLPEMVAEPTRDDAVDALILLKELLAEFPFTGAGSLAVALSALITPVVRAALDAAPMHATTAPQAGSGKSYVFDIAAAIALGQLCPVIAAGKTEDEMEKRLGAALMAGQPIISIDNVNSGLGGEMLCQAIERPLITPRILGKSEIGQVLNRATFFATGNNLSVLDDMTRRVVIAALDAGQERPELRRFAVKPAQIVLADRGPYVAACLTIVRAYHIAGRPGCLAPLASFEAWSDSVRSALVWLGEDDPIVTMEKARENDPGRIELATVMNAWAAEIGAGRSFEMKAAELLQKINAGQMAIYRYPRLREAFHAVMSEKNLNSKSLGRWLSKNADKISDGLKLKKIADAIHGHSFYLDDPSARLL